MEFATHGLASTPRLRRFADGVSRALERHGHARIGDPDRASLVLNFFPADDPRSFRRKSRSVFLAGVTRVTEVGEPALGTGYPLLVRSLSNLQVVLEGEVELPDVHFFTPERGHYVVRAAESRVVAGARERSESGNGRGHRGGGSERGGRTEQGYFEQIYARLAPLAESTLVIENVFVPDLPETLREGDEATRALSRAGRRLGELDLLPSPFPVEEILPAGDRRHLERLFGIGGLSYGNVSARKDGERFWMSASGVDKSRLREIGREIQLVTGYDREANAIRVSVPPDVEPRRVSVDAIEHWMIYREHPEVGAVLHVHAWMDDVPVTDFNYPCGTYELAAAVAGKVREAPDPASAVVGLRNHGLTITGRTLEGIFDRIEDRIQRRVPMV